LAWLYLKEYINDAQSHERQIYFVKFGLPSCWNDFTRGLSSYINLITLSSYLLTFLQQNLRFQHCGVRNVKTVA